MKKSDIVIIASIVTPMIIAVVWLMVEIVSGSYKTGKITNKTFWKSEVKQSYMENYLYTKAVFNGETIWRQYDKINLQSNDSIKLIRYHEAEMWIDKFEKIESVK